MQSQLLDDDDCACFLVEAIAQKSQNIKWKTTVDGKKVSHRRIRRVSIDQFYALVTGEKDAFYQMCRILPETIKDVVDNNHELHTPNDVVIEELRNVAMNTVGNVDDFSMAVAVYLLGFSSYNGFSKLAGAENQDEDLLRRIYSYAKWANNSLSNKDLPPCGEKELGSVIRTYMTGDDECNAESTEYSCGGIYNHNYMDVVGNRDHDCFWNCSACKKGF